MKHSGSPCPHDQMSIIILKRYPYKRTPLQRIITHCWQKQIFPEELRNAFTILIWKRASNKDPANGKRPTENVTVGIFKSVLFIHQKYNVHLHREK